MRIMEGAARPILGAAKAESAIARRGMMFVVSSPSGAGKTTLARRLRAADPDLAVSVSCATRPMRAGEREGVDYYFVDPPRFREMAAAGDLLEWAEVFGNYYGTPRKPVDDWLARGRDVLFAIDWQGARQLRAAAAQDVVSVFIVPPSMAELERRLRERGQDSPDVIADRMRKAAAELSHWAEYDYIIVNDDIDEAEAKIAAVLLAERLRRARLTGLEAQVARIMGGGDAL